ncbi:MAG: dTDP-4-dehydrorhamnose reductase [Fimbriimonadaceae bacterium]|nr:dTDP-4-dehydrorhamnose reductase [Fimbriimonadaceae bacterium]
MRIFVTGASGQLGSALRHLSTPNHDLTAVTRAEFDIANPEHVARLGAGELGAFDAIINAAAYTKVDRAESERQAAHDANALGPGYLAHAAERLRARLVHISTDFVFDGHADRPYVETDATGPTSVYGQTKLEGERAASGFDTLIFRTSWVFSPYGPCFPATMLRLAQSGKPLRVVADQTGTPTAADDLAATILAALEAGIPSGVYHAAGPDICTWHAFARQVLDAAGFSDVEVAPIPTSEYPTPARRPAYSALDGRKLAATGAARFRPLADTIAEFVTRAASSARSDP